MITLPNQVPNHETVGHYFMNWNGEVFYCDSYDSSSGFWMTNIKTPPDRIHMQDEGSIFRKNVSVNVIGKTFHRMLMSENGEYGWFGGYSQKRIPKAELIIPLIVRS